MRKFTCQIGWLPNIMWVPTEHSLLPHTRCSPLLLPSFHWFVQFFFASVEPVILECCVEWSRYLVKDRGQFAGRALHQEHVKEYSQGSNHSWPEPGPTARKVFKGKWQWWCIHLYPRETSFHCHRNCVVIIADLFRAIGNLFKYATNSPSMRKCPIKQAENWHLDPRVVRHTKVYKNIRHHCGTL